MGGEQVPLPMARRKPWPGEVRSTAFSLVDVRLKPEKAAENKQPRAWLSTDPLQ